MSILETARKTPDASGFNGFVFSARELDRLPRWFSPKSANGFVFANSADFG
jgi:hypothetical protein